MQPSPLQSTTDSFFNTNFWQNVVVAVLSAVLAFLSGYALAGIGKKKGSGKKLSYNLSIENGLIQIEKNVRKRVKVFYDSEAIENLYDVRFNLENTGNKVVKSQEIRFEFPEKTRILDFSFEPEPEEEMKVEKIDSGLRDFESKVRIGQLEKDQSIGIRFTATSTVDIQDVKLHPYNEEGDVEFESRTINKALSDRDQVAKFLSLYIFYMIIPPILYLFPFIGDTLAAIVRFVILISLFKFIVPFSEIIADIIFRFISRGEEINVFHLQRDIPTAVLGGQNINITDSKDASAEKNQ